MLPLFLMIHISVSHDTHICFEWYTSPLHFSLGNWFFIEPVYVFLSVSKAWVWIEDLYERTTPEELTEGNAVKTKSVSVTLPDPKVTQKDFIGLHSALIIAHNVAARSCAEIISHVPRTTFSLFESGTCRCHQERKTPLFDNLVHSGHQLT